MKQQDKQNNEQAKAESQQRRAAIGQHAIETLGRPAHLHTVQVRLLWDDHYRVNILVGENASCAKVAHSYFLVTDSSGKVLASTPKITKQY